MEIAWEEMKGEWNEFDVDDPSRDNLFSERWADQRYRTSRLKPERSHMPFDQVRYFIEFAIEISEQPIREDVLPYNTYPGAPFSYLVNSGESGMRLYYDDDDPWEIKTKRAAIIVGGQILSRGLTIEGLSVSFFGRTARMPMGDTVLQMGRWFGHKKSYIDLISIYMQDGLRVLFRHIAEADRYLRVQIKDRSSGISGRTRYSSSLGTAPNSEPRARRRAGSSTSAIVRDSVVEGHYSGSPHSQRRPSNTTTTGSGGSSCNTGPELSWSTIVRKCTETSPLMRLSRSSVNYAAGTPRPKTRIQTTLDS